MEIRSLVIPPNAMNRPVNMKSGTAIRVKVSIPVNIRWTKIIIGTSEAQAMPPTAANAVQIAIGTLNTIRPIMMTKTIAAIISVHLP
jgi:hypothetical protein